MAWVILMAFLTMIIYYITQNSKRSKLILSSNRLMADCYAQQSSLNEELDKLSRLIDTGEISIDEFDKSIAELQSKQNEIDKKFIIASKELDDAENILPLVASVLSSKERNRN